MIGIIDYKRGNIHSVMNALNYLKQEVKLLSSPDEFDSVSRLILPGVGAFGDGMEQLNKLGFTEVIKKKIKSGIPFLGICLGLQLLFESSEENPEVQGLSIFKGKVVKFKGDFKIPHMGWNQVDFSSKNTAITKDVVNNSYFYFVHSYKVEPVDESIILGKTNYFNDFVSAIYKDNVCAIQFHPEKSQDCGLKLLLNWVKSC